MRKTSLNELIDDASFERDALAMGTGAGERVAKLSSQLNAAESELAALRQAEFEARAACANSLGALNSRQSRIPAWQIDQKRVDAMFFMLVDGHAL